MEDVIFSCFCIANEESLDVKYFTVNVFLDMQVAEPLISAWDVW